VPYPDSKVKSQKSKAKGLWVKCDNVGTNAAMRKGLYFKQDVPIWASEF
jgi:hypothetical protein